MELHRHRAALLWTDCTSPHVERAAASASALFAALGLWVSIGVAYFVALAVVAAGLRFVTGLPWVNALVVAAPGDDVHSGLALQMADTISAPQGGAKDDGCRPCPHRGGAYFDRDWRGERGGTAVPECPQGGPCPHVTHVVYLEDWRSHRAAG